MPSIDSAAPVTPETQTQIWSEVSKRIRLFKCVQYLGFATVLIACFFSPWQREQMVIGALIAMALYLVEMHAAAMYANSYRCPVCQQPFMHIKANRRTPLQEVKYDGHSASCNHCGLTVQAPQS